MTSRVIRAREATIEIHFHNHNVELGTPVWVGQCDTCAAVHVKAGTVLGGGGSPSIGPGLLNDVLRIPVEGKPEQLWLVPRKRLGTACGQQLIRYTGHHATDWTGKDYVEVNNRTGWPSTNAPGNGPTRKDPKRELCNGKVYQACYMDQAMSVLLLAGQEALFAWVYDHPTFKTDDRDPR